MQDLLVAFEHCSRELLAQLDCFNHLSTLIELLAYST